MDRVQRCVLGDAFAVLLIPAKTNFKNQRGMQAPNAIGRVRRSRYHGALP